jgi:hypothetical protein
MFVILKNDIDGTSSIVPSSFTWTGDLDVVGHKESFSMWAATILEKIYGDYLLIPQKYIIKC